MEQKSLIIIQVGTAPEPLRDVHGDIPDWFCRCYRLLAG